MNNIYDSVAESTFHSKHSHLNLITDSFYNHNFTDESGITFKAKPDFYDPDTNTYIEFKSHQLNTKPTKLKAKSDLQRVVDYKGKELLIDKLKHDWNHSLYKQAAVQQTLSVNNSKMVVIFSDNTKLSTQSKNKMCSLGLEWFYEADYFC